MKQIKGSDFPFDFNFSDGAIKNFDLTQVLGKLKNSKSLTLPAKIRIFVQGINEKLKDNKKGDQIISAAHFMGMGLINEIYYYISYHYTIESKPKLWQGIHHKILKKRKEIDITELLKKILINFPPDPTSGEKISASLHPDKKDKKIASLLEDTLHIYLFNNNPAFNKFYSLSSNEKLKVEKEYLKVLDTIIRDLTESPGIGPHNNDLYNLFLEPIKDSPNSIFDQLAYIQKYWVSLLPDYLLLKILQTLDIIKEEETMRGAPGPVQTFVPDYAEDDLYPEYEAFSEDKDWMSKVVLVTKSTYVWLFQLSRTYNRQINTLDKIPSEELDRLARWGFTGLWLIGLWQRSSASQKIKRYTGNPEAISSAYSLYDYEISDDLGGDKALEILRARLQKRGIRLAADMIPNHMGIYSKWLIEKPDFFLTLDHPPFPSYSFESENLSDDPRVGVFIEDGYWSQSDAAVVFKRIDFHTGATKYIYHGNDGTHTPWNDTAQLDFLNPVVREEVIRVIIRVAKKFPIIRFDAAMTLARKHIQRLWYPKPGTGGAIPSRSEHSLSSKEFHDRIPIEFWREVVDRLAKEAPETLLLAEAFWMMEGYFVRTLGMHRVYNSAFMNMLKLEENQKYRNLIKETLEFNPEILKRYVNYMNNPDEDTAIGQFGKEDKYFGVALMMVTMPGLPMWGHGQIEGFTEKYGMEYARSYYDEHPDQRLIQRHERELFPLMRRRSLFSNVKNFTFFDFFTQENGSVDENVFAFSNRSDREKTLVIYNNRFGNTQGWISLSTRIIDKEKSSDNNKVFIRKNLIDALALSPGQNRFIIFQDFIQNLEFLRITDEIREKGLYADLNAYGRHVFINFREVEDTNGTWLKFYHELGGSGVRDISKAYRRMILRPILTPLFELCSLEAFEMVLELTLSVREDIHANNLFKIKEEGISFPKSVIPKKKLKKFPTIDQNKNITNYSKKQIRDSGLPENLLVFHNALTEFSETTDIVNKNANTKNFIKNMSSSMSAIVTLYQLKTLRINSPGHTGKPDHKSGKWNLKARKTRAKNEKKFYYHGVVFLFLEAIYDLLTGDIKPPKTKSLKGEKEVSEEQEDSIIDKWFLEEHFAGILKNFDPDTRSAKNLFTIAKIWSDFAREKKILKRKDFNKFLVKIFKMPGARNLIQLHIYDNIEWFHKESFEMLIDWIWNIACFNVIKKNPKNFRKIFSFIIEISTTCEIWKEKGKLAKYRQVEFLEYLIKY